MNLGGASLFIDQIFIFNWIFNEAQVCTYKSSLSEHSFPKINIEIARANTR